MLSDAERDWVERLFGGVGEAPPASVYCREEGRYYELREEVSAEIDGRLARRRAERWAARDRDGRMAALLEAQGDACDGAALEVLSDLLLERGDPLASALRAVVGAPDLEPLGLRRFPGGVLAVVRHRLLGLEMVLVPPIDHDGVYRMDAGLAEVTPRLVGRDAVGRGAAARLGAPLDTRGPAGAPVAVDSGTHEQVRGWLRSIGLLLAKRYWYATEEYGVRASGHVVEVRVERPAALLGSLWSLYQARPDVEADAAARAGDMGAWVVAVELTLAREGGMPAGERAAWLGLLQGLAPSMRRELDAARWEALLTRLGMDDRGLRVERLMGYVERHFALDHLRYRMRLARQLMAQPDDADLWARVDRSLDDVDAVTRADAVLSTAVGGEAGPDAAIPGVPDRVVAALEDPATEVRAAAICGLLLALDDVGRDAARDRLVAAMRDPSPDVRDQAVDLALFDYLREGPGAEDVLLRMAAETPEAPLVVIRGARVARETRDDPAMQRRLERLLRRLTGEADAQ